MVLRDSQILNFRGSIVTQGANFEIDASDIAYVVLGQDFDSSVAANTVYDTFNCYCRIAGVTGLQVVSYKRNSRTMAEFKAAIDLSAPNNTLKLYTNLVGYNGATLVSGEMLYDSTCLVNDAFIQSGSYTSPNTTISLGAIIEPVAEFVLTGNQLGSAPSGVYFEQTTPVAVNATATLTASQVAAGTITSTSAAATSLTLPTATLTAAAINGGANAGDSFQLVIDNSAGANIVTILTGVGWTLDADVTTAAGAVSIYDIYFTSTTTAVLKSGVASYADQTFTGTTTTAALNVVGTANINASGAAATNIGTGTGVNAIGNATGATTITGATVGVTGNTTVTGNLTYTGIEVSSGTAQALSGAGAVNITTAITNYTSTGVAEALTLADGAQGQHKYVIHVVDGGSGVLTPTNFNGGTTITFTNAGDNVHLLFTGTKWNVVGINGAVVA